MKLQLGAVKNVMLKVGLHARFFTRFFETISFVLGVAAKNRVESVETDSKHKSRAIF